jgi:hypothetical protein
MSTDAEREQVNRSWCFRYGLMVEADLATDGTRIDHYDPENPCPGPHGEMYAAVGPATPARDVSDAPKQF